MSGRKDKGKGKAREDSEELSPPYDNGSSEEDVEEVNQALEALSRNQVLEINAAFDSLGKQDEHSEKEARRRAQKPAKKKRRTSPPQAAGGFLLDDDDDMDSTQGGGGFMPADSETSGGGFIPEDTSSERGPSRRPLHIDKRQTVPLDSIPDILESLNLDGDDPSVLSIFENASFVNKGEDSTALVNRRDFLKVAAILVAQRDEENEPAPKLVKSGGGRRRAVRMDVDEEGQAGDHDDSDPLVLSSDEQDEEEYDNANEDSDPWADEDDLDGAFGEGKESSPPSTRRATRSSKGRKKEEVESLPSDSSETPVSGKASTAPKGKAKGQSKVKGKSKDYRLSADQKTEVKRMFNMFFPTNDTSKNINGISLQEIRYVATLLNEKISDADVDEMLEVAAGARGKNVDLEAFTRIMVDTKTV